jgi:hypothetical protein
MGTVWRVAGWLTVLAGFALVLFLLDKFLPPLDRGVLRAGLRGGIAGGIAALIYQTSRGIAARGRQMRAETAGTAMTRDPRAPVLYLRSFKDDKFSYFDLTNNFEETVASVFRNVGPVIAIGQPDESLPPVGAARLHVGNEQWQTVVKRLLEQAAVAIIRVGASPGVLWEVRTAVQCVPPDRLLVAIPPEESKRVRMSREAAYTAFRDLVNDCFSVPLPLTIGDGLFIAFHADWTPYTLGGASDSGIRFMPSGVFRRALKPFFEQLGIPVSKRAWGVAPQLALLALTVAFTQFINQAGPPWKQFTASGGKITASLPGAAEQSQEKIQSPRGELVMSSWKASWNGAGYSASYIDYPQDVIQSGSTDNLLSAARDGMLQNTKAKLLRETYITVDRYPGRELIAELKVEKTLIKCRIVLAGRELVMMIAALPDDQEYPFKNSTDVQTFFDSLHVKP